MGNILVIDDDPLNRRLLTATLERQGHRASSAEDGKTALAMLAEDRPDVVLLDLVMPGMDGIEVLERIKADDELRHLPVIVISGVDDAESVVRCIEMGAEDFLPKPFDPVILQARVNAGLNRKALHDLEQQRVRSVFARFVPESLVGALLDRTDGGSTIPAESLTGTVLFGDLRGFTPFAESLPVDQVIDVLNHYLSLMTDAILDNGGTLVDYMGDGVMAAFGAPVPVQDHADRAVAAARSMLTEKLPAFNGWLGTSGIEDGFRMGIGINSGPVMSGSVGSERRLEYAVIGDTVNTASRIEGITKQVPHSVLISEGTYTSLRTTDGLVFVDEFEIRGRRVADQALGPRRSGGALMGDKKLKKLKHRVHELEAQAQVDAALYRIAQAASSVTDMQAFYAAMHGIVGELMDASNFYIALYDDERQMINFPYYVDEVDTDLPDPNVWEPFGVGNARGATAYVLRTGEPMRTDAAGLGELIAAGEVELVGELGQDWLGVPLKSEGRTLGVMVVQTYTPDKRLSRSDLEILTVVGGHIATALERTRLLSETRQRSAELALVNDVQRGLAERLEMQAMYDLVGDRIQAIFDAQVVDIGILDPASGLIHFPYTIERGVRFPDEPIEVIGLRRIALETREPVVINEDIEAASVAAGQPFVLAGEPPKSSVFVPLIVGDRAIGVISLQNLDREHAFIDADVRLLTTLAGSLSVALENARLFEEIRQRNSELALINDVRRGLAERLEMQAMFDVMGDRIQEIFDAQVVDIGVLDVDAGQMAFPYTIERGVRIPHEPIEVMGFRKVALETREPVVINEDIEAASAAIGQPTVLVGEPPKSTVFVPLLVGDRGVGVISLQNLDREHAFSDDDVRLLTTLAGSLTVALENARLFEETRQRNAELALVNDVQRGLAENLGMQAAYDFVGDRIQEIFDAQVVDIGILERDSRILHYPYSIERGVRYPDEPLDLDESNSLSRYVIETGASMLINDRVTERIAEMGGAQVDGLRRSAEVAVVRAARASVAGRPAGSRCRTSIASTRSPRRTPVSSPRSPRA